MNRYARVFVALAASVIFLAMAVPALAAPQATVSGTVYGSDTIAIPGAPVTVSLADKNGVYAVVANLTTNSGGWWTYGGKVGNYKFDFAAPSSDPATKYLTMENKGVYTLDVTLQSYGTIAGAVTDQSTALPLPGATVEIYKRNSDGTWPATPLVTVVTPDGAHASGLLQTGVYRVKASATGYIAKYYGDTGLGPRDITVNRGSALTGMDVALTPAVVTATITGRVVRGATETPIANTYVWFYKQNADGTWPAYTPGWGTPTKTVFTDAAGNYNSGDLPVGNYKVRFWGGSMTGSQYWQYVTTWDLATVIPLWTEGEVLTGIDGWFSKPL